jgi:hypothetical protein
VGSTRQNHQMALILPAGLHTITIVDKEGNEASVTFTVKSQEKQITK